jgi:hypothetical protein
MAGREVVAREPQTSSRRRKWDEPAGVWRSCQRAGQAPHLCSPLRVPLDTSGLQTLSMRSPVGRLCQTPGRWDAATPGSFHFLAHAHRSLSIGGRSGYLRLGFLSHLAGFHPNPEGIACPIRSIEPTGGKRIASQSNPTRFHEEPKIQSVKIPGDFAAGAPQAFGLLGFFPALGSEAAPPSGSS